MAPSIEKTKPCARCPKPRLSYTSYCHGCLKAVREEERLNPRLLRKVQNPMSHITHFNDDGPISCSICERSEPSIKQASQNGWDWFTGHLSTRFVTCHSCLTNRANYAFIVAKRQESWVKR